MALVNFKQGLLANLPKTYTEGTFYVVTDERAIYLDVSDSSRIRLGDFQEFANLEALNANKNPSQSALYYIADINCLAKYDGQKYVQINTDTGATSIEVVGDGNAVTSATYNAANRKITLTMGETFLKDEDVDSKISEAIEALDLDDTYDAKGAADEALSDAKEYTDQKNTAMDTRVKAVEAAKHTHSNADELDLIATGDKAKWDAAAADVSEIKADYLDSDDKTELEGKIDAKQDTIVFETAYNAETNKAATMSDVNAAVSGLSGAMHWKGTVEKKPDAAMGADYSTGDVVSFNGVEYAWDGSAWQELGDESKYSAKAPGWDAAAEKAHEHSNLTLLETYDQTNAAIKDAVEKAHTHANGDELAKIQTGDKNKWDGAASKADANASAIEDILDGDTIDSFSAVEGALEGKQDKIPANTYDAYGDATKALNDAKSYVDSALTWGSF